MFLLFGISFCSNINITQRKCEDRSNQELNKYSILWGLAQFLVCVANDATCAFFLSPENALDPDSDEFNIEVRKPSTILKTRHAIV